MSTTVRVGGLLVLDPSEKRVVQFDWGSEGLTTGVEISSSSWAITAIQQNGATALTKDQESIVAGNRSTQVRLLATTATAGDRYMVENTIITNETPAQTIPRSVQIKVENL